MGCSSCRDANTFYFDNRPKMHHSDEWINGVVGSTCKKTNRVSASHHWASDITSHKLFLQIHNLTDYFLDVVELTEVADTSFMYYTLTSLQESGFHYVFSFSFP